MNHPMFAGIEFRRFAIDELGEGAAEFSTATLQKLLEKKAEREGWSHLRFSYPVYGTSKALPEPPRQGLD